MVRMVEQDGQLRCIFDGSLNTITCLELEKELTDYLVFTEDFEEGTAAFIEKRKPNFKVK